MSFKSRLDNLKSSLLSNKFEAIPTSKNGLYDYPNQEVRVPTSGHITMQGIEYPVLGISEQTGEEQLMYPENEYYFDNTSTVREIPLMQDGGRVPTRQDSLFLLNNNKVIEGLLDKGYRFNHDGFENYKKLSDVSQEEWRENYERLVEKLPRLIMNDIRDGEKQKTYHDYIDIQGDFVGTQDWLPEGGEDYFMPKQYIHPNIKPQFQGDLSSPDESHQIYAYGYDNLAITPVDMLTPRQREERLIKYGTSGFLKPVPVQRPKVSSLSSDLTSESSLNPLNSVQLVEIPTYKTIGNTNYNLTDVRNQDRITKRNNDGLIELLRVGTRDEYRSSNLSPTGHYYPEVFDSKEEYEQYRQEVMEENKRKALKQMGLNYEKGGQFNHSILENTTNKINQILNK